MSEQWRLNATDGKLHFERKVIDGLHETARAWHRVHEANDLLSTVIARLTSTLEVMVVRERAFRLQLVAERKWLQAERDVSTTVARMVAEARMELGFGP